VLVSAGVAFAGTIALLPSTSQFNEPNQIVATLDYLITQINGVSEGVVASLQAPVTTTGTTANTIVAYTVPAGLPAGQAYRIKGWGVNSADANAKTITVNFGTSAPTLVVTGSGNTWQFEAVVQNVGTVASPSQDIALSGSTGTTLVALTNTNSTQALTSALALNVQLTAATSGTMTMNGLTIEAVR
jgi:hypothetical protein